MTSKFIDIEVIRHPVGSDGTMQFRFTFNVVLHPDGLQVPASLLSQQFSAAMTAAFESEAERLRGKKGKLRIAFGTSREDGMPLPEVDGGLDGVGRVKLSTAADVLKSIEAAIGKVHQIGDAMPELAGGDNAHTWSKLRQFLSEARDWLAHAIGEASRLANAAGFPATERGGVTTIQRDGSVDGPAPLTVGRDLGEVGY